MRVALVDYRAGNLASVRKALEAVGAEVFVPASPAGLDSAAAVVVPGVGHFSATAALGVEWRAAVTDGLAAGRPLLGICLGMQWLYEGSEEAPELPGLGLLRGRCRLLQPAQSRQAATPSAVSLKVPHVGWNDIMQRRASRLLDGVAQGAQAYFTHSYVAPVTADTIATTSHGEEFASAVEKGRVFGAQFHPEKSGEMGQRVLVNFLEMVRSGDSGRYR